MDKVVNKTLKLGYYYYSLVKICGILWLAKQLPIVLTVSDLIKTTKFHKIKKAWIRCTGEREIRTRIDILEDLTTTVIKVLYQNEKILYLSKQLSFDYKLLPNDALIAATCKHYGIKNIATFDSDFDSVDFLDVITP